MRRAGLKSAYVAFAGGAEANRQGYVLLRNPEITAIGDKVHKPALFSVSEPESTGLDHHRAADSGFDLNHTQGVKAESHWYLKEWAERAGRRQADVARDLGWQKNTTHKLWYNKQPYSAPHVAAVAAWLGIEQFELLMLPADALALRKLREAAREIVQGDQGVSSGHARRSEAS